MDRSGSQDKLTTGIPVAPWFVVHTRPRREKKLIQYCEREGIAATLPQYESVRKYRGKTVVFHKPLFPGYAFLRLNREVDCRKVAQNDHVARLLTVPDQAEFEAQLEDILLALDTGLEIRLAPEIGEGIRVKIKSGPLRGLEGWVEKRYGMSTVLLRLDFIGQAAAVRLAADDLEPV
jgi:transcription antitermination factor NusG